MNSIDHSSVIFTESKYVGIYIVVLRISFLNTVNMEIVDII